ncbi:MAG: hypothetical protein LBQ40_04460 [Clostridiales bacterium]|jgi:phage-related protein|nr:hypothetical protein [Clostridiales bacterium]
MAEYAGDIKLKVTLDTAPVDKGVEDIKAKVGQAGKEATKPLADSDKKTKETQKSYSKMAAGIAGTLKKIKTMIVGAFVFALIRKGIESVSEHMRVMFKQNEALSNSFGQIKGNLETTFITVMQSVMPVIEQLGAVLVKVTAYVSAFTAAMFGKTVVEAQAAAKNISDAAKKAKGSMAGFDEINVISGNDDESITSKFVVDAEAESGVADFMGGIGGTLKDVLASIFDAIKTMIPKIINIIKKLLPVVESVLKVVVALLPVIALILDAIEPLFDPIATLISDAIVPLIGLLSDILSVILPPLLAILSNDVKAVVAIVISGIQAFLTILNNVIDFVKNVFAGNWSAAWGNIVNIFDAYIGHLKNIFYALIDGMKNNIAVVANFFKEKFAPVGEFFVNLWEGILKNFKLAFWGVQAGIITVVNFIVNAINKMAEGVLAPINAIIDGLNKIPGVSIGKLSLSIPTLTLPPIPALAQGGVVPRSKPFLAMLGDNTEETEVVSPLSTMKQAVIEALSEVGYNGGEKTIILEVDGRQLGSVVVDMGDRERGRRGVSLVVANV